MKTSPEHRGWDTGRAATALARAGTCPLRGQRVRLELGLEMKKGAGLGVFFVGSPSHTKTKLSFLYSVR